MTEFIDVTKFYNGTAVLDNFCLSLPKGSKIAVMGESGSGKTTLLRIAAGLTQADKGEFRHEGGIALMFQEPRLLPWKNALENVSAVLPKNVKSLADKYLSATGLADAANKFPHELSGGMAQRVAFARFLAYADSTNASLLLLDEPFSALDSETGARMIALLKQFSKDKTVLLVTHDEADAKSFADTVVRL